MAFCFARSLCELFYRLATRKLKSARQAIALNPRARSYHFVLGLVLRQEQRWNDAPGAFQQELALNPNGAGAATHVADLRTRAGK